MSKNSHTLVLASALILAAPIALAMGSRPKVDEEAANSRIQPVAKVELAAAAPKAAAGSRTGEELYKGVCGACHETGAAGAPKAGDKAAWAPRIGLGLDGLTKSAIKGKNAMPPKGGSDATDEELARAIAFMANKSGANFSAK
ncbi:c-type cytochrome [Sulfurisoma sediminicola]|uniref:Cytochrome c5 n=1 Tax=Sulfurisoma sediminicola TaxID=1381557 RepID=A0A497XLY9_9PROT|nr:c-type cytochrome [Sulfurisoma sediminicola]RLJ68266.1 cytochrome c5 [Sulfurisoma sediminicola]